ncbi:MAG TPA: hypothetical protein VKE74_15575 [Gemmataceae bacterium]|nr:hypothetical protein [Gemmataceae bacterium]
MAGATANRGAIQLTIKAADSGPLACNTLRGSPVDEYLCVTLLARPGESETEFKARLTAFWTHMLRSRPDDYAKVYAEATAFGTAGGRVSRQYMVEAGVVGVLTNELSAAGVEYVPVDEDDTYSKYEAAPPDWFWIEH